MFEKRTTRSPQTTASEAGSVTRDWTERSGPRPGPGKPASAEDQQLAEDERGVWSALVNGRGPAERDRVGRVSGGEGERLVREAGKRDGTPVRERKQPERRSDKPLESGARPGRDDRLRPFGGEQTHLGDAVTLALGRQTPRESGGHSREPREHVGERRLGRAARAAPQLEPDPKHRLVLGEESEAALENLGMIAEDELAVDEPEPQPNGFGDRLRAVVGRLGQIRPRTRPEHVLPAELDLGPGPQPAVLGAARRDGREDVVPTNEPPARPEWAVEPRAGGDREALLLGRPAASAAPDFRVERIRRLWMTDEEGPRDDLLELALFENRHLEDVPDRRRQAKHALDAPAQRPPAVARPVVVGGDDRDEIDVREPEHRRPHGEAPPDVDGREGRDEPEARCCLPDQDRVEERPPPAQRPLPGPEHEPADQAGRSSRPVSCGSPGALAAPSAKPASLRRRPARRREGS